MTRAELRQKITDLNNAVDAKQLALQTLKSEINALQKEKSDLKKELRLLEKAGKNPEPEPAPPAPPADENVPDPPVA